MKIKNIKKRYIVIAVILIAVVILIAMGSKGSDTAGYASEEVKVQNITTYYSFSGNLKPVEKKSFTSDGNCEIKKILVKEGDTVNIGDEIYTVDNTDYDNTLKQAKASLDLARVNYESAKDGSGKQQLMQAENAYNSAKLNYENAEKSYNDCKVLFEAEIISKSDYDSARTAYENAKQQYETAKSTYELTRDTLVVNNEKAAAAQLSQAEAAYDSALSGRVDDVVKAEFSGEITKIYINDGDTIMKGSPTVDIADFSQMIATVKVDEYDMSAMSEGKEVTCTVDALEKSFDGVVDRISKTAVTQAGISYYEADVIIPSDGTLLEGMSVEVKALNKNVENAVTISMKALQFDNENKPFVYTKEKGKLTQKYVTIGANDGLTVEIKEGLLEGETVYYQKSLFDFPMMME